MDEARILRLQTRKRDCEDWLKKYGATSSTDQVI